MTGVYANPERWAEALAGWDNTLPLSVSLLPHGKDHFTVASGWVTDQDELIGDQYRESPWRIWVVQHMMTLHGPDYQQAGSDRYWKNPARVQAEVDEIAAGQAGPAAELHIPLTLLRSAQPLTPAPSAPSPPSAGLEPDPVPPTRIPPAAAPRGWWRR